MLTPENASRLYNAFGPDAAAEAGLLTVYDMVAEADALTRTIRQEYRGLDNKKTENVVYGCSLLTVVDGWITTAYGPAQDPAESGYGPDEAEAQAELVAAQAARTALVGRIAATGLFNEAEVARLAGRRYVAPAAAAVA